MYTSGFVVDFREDPVVTFITLHQSLFRFVRFFKPNSLKRAINYVNNNNDDDFKKSQYYCCPDSTNILCPNVTV